MKLTLLIFAALVVVSLVATLRMLVLGSRVAAALSLPGWDRVSARRVAFRGVVNAPEVARPAISRFRIETLIYYVVLMTIFYFLIGPGILLMVALFGLVALASEPLDLGEYRT